MRSGDVKGFKVKQNKEKQVRRDKMRSEDEDGFKEGRNKEKQVSRDRMRKKNESQLTRRHRYYDAVREGLIYSCVCCKKRKFSKQVCVYTGEYPYIAESVVRGAVGEAFDPKQQVRGEFYICNTCQQVENWEVASLAPSE